MQKEFILLLNVINRGYSFKRNYVNCPVSKNNRFHSDTLLFLCRGRKYIAPFPLPLFVCFYVKPENFDYHKNWL